MNVSEKIWEEVEKLPEPLRAEVLDFVQYLASKVEQEGGSSNDPSAARLSLSLAMRDMEDEDTPNYSIKDLKEVFS